MLTAFIISIFCLFLAILILIFNTYKHIMAKRNLKNTIDESFLILSDLASAQKGTLPPPTKNPPNTWLTPRDITEPIIPIKNCTNCTFISMCETKNYGKLHKQICDNHN